MRSLISELRRRNVFRVGAAYLVLSWLIVQVTDTIAPPLGLPDWTLSLVIWLLAIGLPIALVLAWAFELTPDGVKRSEDVPLEESVTAKTGGHLNTVILVLMAAAITVLLVDRFLLTPPPDDGSDPVAATLQESRSVAVMPFENLSEESANELFADGLAEELLNLLTKVDGLRVMGRASSFHFKGKSPSMGEIAESLGVDAIVQGSVRRSGNQVRVIVQLVSTDTGSNLWSDRYDRPLDDLFTVQDDIANQVIAALMPHLSVAERPVVASDTGEIETEHFERFLLARQKYYDRTDASRLEARDDFLAVTKAAPDYAPAWAWLARTWVALLGALEVDEDIAQAAAREAIETALALDPNEPMAYVAQGLMFRMNEEHEQAVRSYNRAIELNPGLVDAYILQEDPLKELGNADVAVELLFRAREIDPLHPSVLTSLAHLLNLQGKTREAFAVIDKLETVSPVSAAYMEAHMYADNSDFARAVYVAEQSGHVEPEGVGLYLMLLGLHQPLSEMQTSWRPVSLAVLGRREDALLAMDEAMAAARSQHMRMDIEYRTYVGLGEFETAADLLWERYSRPDTSEPDWELSIVDLISLGALMRKLGRTELIQPVLDSIQAKADTLSPLHDGAYLYNKGYAALLVGDVDGAVQHLRQLVDMGDGGVAMFGNSAMYPWLFEHDPRLREIAQQLTANNASQVAELQRLRDAGRTAAEVRKDYLTSRGDAALGE